MEKEKINLEKCLQEIEEEELDRVMQKGLEDRERELLGYIWEKFYDESWDASRIKIIFFTDGYLEWRMYVVEREILYESKANGVLEKIKVFHVREETNLKGRENRYVKKYLGEDELICFLRKILVRKPKRYKVKVFIKPDMPKEFFELEKMC